MRNESNLVANGHNRQDGVRLATPRPDARFDVPVDGTTAPVSNQCGCLVHSAIYVSDSDAVCVASTHISLQGEWSDANTHALLPLLESAIRLPSALVVIDLSAVRSRGSHLAEALARLHALLAAGQTMTVVDAPTDSPMEEPDGVVHSGALEGAREALKLTSRQHEILRLVERGLSTREIAAELWLSPATVRNHVTGILRALGAHSRLRAVHLARDRGLLESR